jgi:hypothetical protein
MGGKVIVVPAVIDRVDLEAAEATWVAQVRGGPAGGVYAIGQSLAEARQDLAEVVWLGIRTGAIEVECELDQVTAVRIWAITRKTFPVERLAVDS